MSHQVSIDASNAFVFGKKFGVGNTLVTMDNGLPTMRIHGNKVAEAIGDDVFITSANHPTTLTHRRLNALLVALGRSFIVKTIKGSSVICSNHKSLNSDEKIYLDITVHSVSVNAATKHFYELIKSKQVSC